MSRLIIEYFPEIRSRIDNEDVEHSYLVANELAVWFDEQTEGRWAEAQSRMRNFYKIISESPRGKDASDDVLTIMQVGFFEKLWRLPNAHKTIPAMTDPEYIIKQKEYLIQWVGEECYERVVKSTKLSKSGKKKDRVRRGV